MHASHVQPWAHLARQDLHQQLLLLALLHSHPVLREHALGHVGLRDDEQRLQRHWVPHLADGHFLEDLRMCSRAGARRWQGTTACGDP